MNHLGGGGTCAENVLNWCPFLSSPVHSGPNRIPRKEDMLALPGYVDLEVKLFAMMREEIQ